MTLIIIFLIITFIVYIDSIYFIYFIYFVKIFYLQMKSVQKVMSYFSSIYLLKKFTNRYYHLYKYDP